MAKKKSSAQKKKTVRKTAKKRTTRSKKKKKTSLFAFLFKWAFVLGLWATIILTIIVAWYASELPEITKKIDFARKTAVIIKASDDSTIARYGDLTGQNVDVKDLPANLMNAVLAIEDRRFYNHPGIDFIGFTRAMAVNIVRMRLVQGGSTITQQLAKNLFLSQERTIKRKIQEAILALWLENKLTKDEILSAYLNRVYLGSGAYGVSAASQLYFGKPAEQMGLRESAMIAGLLKAPSRYSPFNNPDLSAQRTDVVLKAMADAGYIEDFERELGKVLPAARARPPSDNIARYFGDWVLDGLDELVGTPSEDLVVETTFDPAIQTTAEAALTKTIMTYGEERKISQGAIIVMRPDGAILAMVGGRNYQQSQFNRATQAKRQPGSAFKPVVYLSAIEHGWDADDKILDEPFSDGVSYQPENFAQKYQGEVTLEEALAKSLNTAAVRLLQAIGLRKVIDTARRLGIRSKLEPDSSLALGTSEVSLLEMSLAYATIANGGYSVFPYAIKRISSLEDGTLYYERPDYRSPSRAFERSDINELRRMLETVITEGTGRAANPGFQSGGKTGTSQNSRDAWFIGYTDELVAGVWLGNDDNSPMDKVTGGSFPARIWKDVIIGSKGAYDPPHFSKSSGFQGLLGRITGSSGTSGYNE